MGEARRTITIGDKLKVVRYYLQLRKKKSDAHGEIVVEPVEKIIGRGSIRPRRVDQKKEAKKESSKSELKKSIWKRSVEKSFPIW